MKQRATGLLAGAAGLGTDTTVLVHGGMPVAFCRTETTSLSAGHQLNLQQHRTRFREARDDASAGEAYVRAVEAGSYAADEVSDVSGAKESASASGTPGTRPIRTSDCFRADCVEKLAIALGLSLSL